MKMASIARIAPKYPQYVHKVIHTGQHFSPEMSQEIFEDLCLSEPDFHLHISSGSGLQQIATMIQRMEPLFEAEKPDFLLVYGDVNSTVAAAITAARMGIPIGHVEAGLRSFDRTMPEELNRIVTDSIANFAYTTEPSGDQNLLHDGWSKENIIRVGNTMIDSLIFMLEKAAAPTPSKTSYLVCTLHRPSNVDDKQNLTHILTELGKLCSTYKIILPLHPRTKNSIANFKLDPLLQPFETCSPQRYSQFLQLVRGSEGIITDSGGIQEEATYLGKKCITLRENTERPVTISQGTNSLLPPNTEKLAEKILTRLNEKRNHTVPEFWDGKSGDRIWTHVAGKIG